MRMFCLMMNMFVIIINNDIKQTNGNVVDGVVVFSSYIYSVLVFIWKGIVVHVTLVLLLLLLLLVLSNSSIINVYTNRYNKADIADA